MIKYTFGALAVALLMVYANEEASPEAVKVDRIIDGDTIAAWVGDVHHTIRLYGIDTPEIQGRCVSEKVEAMRAQNYLHRRLEDATITVTTMGEDIYGRTLAILYDSNGKDINSELVAEGHARIYTGGKRARWCLEEEIQKEIAKIDEEASAPEAGGDYSSP